MWKGGSAAIERCGWADYGRAGRLRRYDIGAAVVYLASDDARSVTGITLKIDGGITVVGP